MPSGGTKGNSGGGRKGIGQEYKVLKRYNAFNAKWWTELKKLMKSDVKSDVKFALSEYNKLQTKKIPQDITSGGSELEFYDKGQIKRVAKRTVRNDEKSKS